VDDWYPGVSAEMRRIERIRRIRRTEQKKKQIDRVNALVLGGYGIFIRSNRLISGNSLEGRMFTEFFTT
jgi:hypothetical protein